jgi:hypothetical protein
VALTYANLDSVTKKYYVNSIPQQVYDENILLDRIAKGKRVKIVSGGTKIFHPIRYRQLGLAEWIDPDAPRVTSSKDTRTALELDWKYLAIDLSMNWAEKAQNRSNAQIVNLLFDKVKEGREDIRLKWSTVLYQAYASKGTLDPDGIHTITQTNLSATTYAGISSTDASSWKCGFYYATAVDLALYGTYSLDHMIRSCYFHERPNLFVTTRGVASMYSSRLQPSERRVPMNGKSGATDLAFQGIPLVADPQCLEGDLHIMNTNHLWLYVQSGYNFKVGKWGEDPNRIEADRSLVTFMGNLVCDMRKVMGSNSDINN